MSFHWAKKLLLGKLAATIRRPQSNGQSPGKKQKTPSVKIYHIQQEKVLAFKAQLAEGDHDC
jgi:hypothetical protein